MSQDINNREYRKNAIKDMLRMLHEGKDAEQVRDYFAEVFENVSASEISAAEQALISEGLPVEEVQKLCDVHASVFKGSIEEIHSIPDAEKPGHPVWIMKEENKRLSQIIDGEIMPALNAAATAFSENKPKLLSGLKKLSTVKAHYQRKENLLFPYLEKYSITGPPQVMWSVDDEIRAHIANAHKTVEETDGYGQHIDAAVEKAVEGVKEMIFKEEHILLPMMLEAITSDEWDSISAEIPTLEYCLITNPPVWRNTKKADKGYEVRKAAHGGDKPASVSGDNAAETEPPIRGGGAEIAKAGADIADFSEHDGKIVTLPTGSFNAQQLAAVLSTLPVDISFVDKNGDVKYFSDNKERIFPRTKAVLGRKVINCHPPASFEIVDKILSDFESGAKDEESFWIKMGTKYIHIRYFAVRSPAGEFLGTLEVSQDIAPIQQIRGEKRLLSDS